MNEIIFALTRAIESNKIDWNIFTADMNERWRIGHDTVRQKIQEVIAHSKREYRKRKSLMALCTTQQENFSWCMIPWMHFPI